jgi:hypothetical protein
MAIVAEVDKRKVDDLTKIDEEDVDQRAVEAEVRKVELNEVIVGAEINEVEISNIAKIITPEGKIDNKGEGAGADVINLEVVTLADVKIAKLPI